MLDIVSMGGEGGGGHRDLFTVGIGWATQHAAQLLNGMEGPEVAKGVDRDIIDHLNLRIRRIK